jgi:hypothetical protein
MNDLYEEYENKIAQPTDKPKPVITDDNFESKLKRIIGETDIEENIYKQDKSNIQPDIQQYEPSFKLVSKRRK